MPAKYEPIEEVKFAAKIGFLSKKIWEEFFARGNVRWQYRCWKRLVDSKIFIPHRIAKDVLVVNARHPFVGKVTDSYNRAPHVNQLFHDEIVGLTYLRIADRLKNWGVFVEAELKRREPLQNRGKKSSQVMKHPDVLATSPSGPRIAIEIELSRKSKTRYMNAFRAYRSKAVSLIIFVVRSSSTLAIIRRAAHEVRFPENEIPIGFCPLHEWEQNLFSAKIDVGRNSNPFLELIRSIEGTPKVGHKMPQLLANANFCEN